MRESSEVLDSYLNDTLFKDETNQEFLHRLLKYEIYKKEEKSFNRRIKAAAFPQVKDLDKFDITSQNGLSSKNLKQLRELTWLESAMNLLVLGPPGVGKTYLSLGLGYDAIKRGYKAYFTRMDDLLHTLKTSEFVRSSKARIKQILDSDLVIIDDMVFLAIDKKEANLLFHLISKLYEQTSIIITSNKGPEEWGELLGEPAIATAILDRLLHRSEVINLYGNSYRLDHRESIFGKH